MFDCEIETIGELGRRSVYTGWLQRVCSDLLAVAAAVAVLSSTDNDARGPVPASVVEAAGDLDQRTQFWRIPENDGVMCLYLLLRVHDLGVDFGELLSLLRPTEPETVNMQMLQETAAKYGLHTRIRSLAPADLARRHTPLITIMDGPLGAGEFVLVLGKTDKACILIDATGSYQEIPIDRFRRAWSGFSLVPMARGPSMMRPLCASVFLLAAYWSWRRYQRWRRPGEGKPRRHTHFVGMI